MVALGGCSEDMTEPAMYTDTVSFVADAGDPETECGCLPGYEPICMAGDAEVVVVAACDGTRAQFGGRPIHAWDADILAMCDEYNEFTNPIPVFCRLR